MTKQSFFSFTRLLSVIVFTYVLLRAILLDITYDEAWSIGTYVNGSFTNILNYVPCDSNNHLINSLVIKVLYFILPATTFVARIPSLLAFIFYLRFAALLTTATKHKTGPYLFALLILNPFLLEFFSLARGYSISMAAVLGSLYYFDIYFKQQQKTVLMKSVGLAALAGLSIFSFLNFFAGMLLICFLHLLLIKKKEYVLTMALLGTVSLSVVALLWLPFQRLTQFGNLYYGGTTSLWQDSFLSLGRYSQYQMFQDASAVIFLVLVLLVLTVIFIHALFEKRHLSFKTLWIFILLLSCLLVNYIQVKLLDGFYLIDRTTLFLYPLLLLSSWPLVQELPALKKTKYMYAGLSLLFLLNTLNHANLKKTLTWFFDSHTREILTVLDKQGEQENRKIPVGCSWPFEKTLTWYLSQGGYPHVEFRWDPEFYLYLDSRLDQIDYYPEKEKLQDYKKGIVLKYPQEHIFVFKR